MECITKVEAAWIADALKSQSLDYEGKAEQLKSEGNQTGAALYKLRSEQYAVLALKFESTVTKGNKRIAVTY